MDPNQELTVDQGKTFSIFREIYKAGEQTHLSPYSETWFSCADGVFNSLFNSLFIHNHHIDHCNVVICILRCLIKTLKHELLNEEKGNTQI